MGLRPWFVSYFTWFIAWLSECDDYIALIKKKSVMITLLIGFHFFTCCVQSLELWNMSENKTMTLSAHEGLIAALAVSTVTGLVASASHDKFVKLWKWYNCLEVTSNTGLVFFYSLLIQCLKYLFWLLYLLTFVSFLLDVHIIPETNLVKLLLYVCYVPLSVLTWRYCYASQTGCNFLYSSKNLYISVVLACVLVCNI